MRQFPAHLTLHDQVFKKKPVTRQVWLRIVLATRVIFNLLVGHRDRWYRLSADAYPKDVQLESDPSSSGGCRPEDC